MDMRLAVYGLLCEAARTAFPALKDTDLPGPEALEFPPDSKLGDFAFPCFRLARPLRLATDRIAAAIAAAANQPQLATAQAVGGYVNFFFHRGHFAKAVLEEISEKGAAYGSQGDQGKTVVLDYSSINIAKRFHIGHLSTTVLGHSLKRIYTHLGWRAIGINHLGDWGTQFGKMIAAFKRWGDWQMLEAGGVEALNALYVRFHQEEEKNPALTEEGRAWFRKIEEGDSEALSIFNRFKELTLAYAQTVYEQLGISFDSYDGEAFFNDKMDRVIEELRQKNLLKPDQGAYMVDLEPYKMPPCLILKSDGATLYATRDLAAALWRKDTYGFDQCLYVVAYQQNLHFKQVFKVLELMGYDWAATQMRHVAFGMVSFEGQAMSTREGNVVHLDELLARAVQKAREIMQVKSPNLADEEALSLAARQVGIGAVVFTTLLNNRIKDIDFWWERALNFDGDTGPYTQYAHARCCSLLARAGDIQAQPDYAALENDEAQAVLRLLSRFPEVITSAMADAEPSYITRATLEVAKAFNKYYYEHRILEGEAGAIAARVLLTRATREVLALGLYLIGVDAPRQM